MKNRSWYIGTSLLVLVVVLAVGQVWLQRAAEAQSRGAAQAPTFEVDPLWPKPLPNHWVLGSTIGVYVHEKDHIWIIHRSSATLSNMEKGAELKTPTGECCVGAPPVL